MLLKCYCYFEILFARHGRPFTAQAVVVFHVFIEPVEYQIQNSPIYSEGSSRVSYIILTLSYRLAHLDVYL